jgi:putative transposase
MARPWRIQYPDAVYHVTSRGNDQGSIFITDHDRKDFLGLLGEGVKRFNLEVFAFCLMSNHYHMFLRTPEGNLSSSIHWLNTTYSIRFHGRHRRSGHLFEGRFKSVLVLDECHFAHLSMYIHLNPLKAGIVKDPLDYEWSSYRDYIRPKSRYDWLDREVILDEYGRGSDRFRRYSSACLALFDTEPSFLQQLQTGTFIGSQEAAEKILKKYRPSGNMEMVPSYRLFSRNVVDVEKELEKVARIFKIKPDDLKKRRRSFPPRKAACWHLVENCGRNIKEVAELMNVKPTAVSMALANFKKMMEKDKDIKKRMESLIVI